MKRLQNEIFQSALVDEKISKQTSSRIFFWNLPGGPALSGGRNGSDQTAAA